MKLRQARKVYCEQRARIWKGNSVSARRSTWLAALDMAERIGFRLTRDAASARMKSGAVRRGLAP